MLVNFFQALKDGGVPVTPRELLDLLAAMNKQLVFGSIDDFYNLSRAVMVKDEKYYDRFDRAFGLHFRDLEGVDDVIEALIPDDWLRSEFVKQLSEEDKAKIESLGGLEKLIDEFKKRLEEQEKRHEGGNKWVGTGGTSPFGNDGFHPEGIRVGGQGKNKKAVKVWDRRDFKNLDDSVEIGTRNIKVALRRLRKFARTGSADELDLDDTISSTARNAGLLDIKMVPERHNAVKVLLFLDVGRFDGSTRQSLRGVVFSRTQRVQALKAFLLSQLPLRQRLGKQYSASQPTYRSARRHAQVWSRLQGGDRR